MLHEALAQAVLLVAVKSSLFQAGCFPWDDKTECKNSQHHLYHDTFCWPMMVHIHDDCSLQSWYLIVRLRLLVASSHFQVCHLKAGTFGILACLLQVADGLVWVAGQKEPPR